MNSLSNIIENIDDIPERKRKEFTERMRGVPFLEVMNSMVEPYVGKKFLMSILIRFLLSKRRLISRRQPKNVCHSKHEK